MVFELTILSTLPCAALLTYLLDRDSQPNFSEINFDAATFVAQPSAFILTGHYLHVSWIEFESTVSTSQSLKNCGGIAPGIFLSSFVLALNSLYILALNSLTIHLSSLGSGHQQAVLDRANH